jgi:hypothetical protein
LILARELADSRQRRSGRNDIAVEEPPSANAWLDECSGVSKNGWIRAMST